MNDLISRQAAIDALTDEDIIEHLDSVYDSELNRFKRAAQRIIAQLPSTQPERLTDDDFETIRIHLNVYKEKLCNQQRWGEAEEYQRIIDRFMAFASAQPEYVTCYLNSPCEYQNKNIALPSAQPQWIPCSERYPEENQICIVTDETMRNTYEYRFCKETYDENQGWTYLKHRIIAWMPLPKPYMGGGQE